MDTTVLSPVGDRVASVLDRLRASAARTDAGQEELNPGYEVLRDAGLLTLLVPEHAGGDGLRFAEYTRVLEQLATADGATALGFNMHNVAIGSLCESGAVELPAGAQRFRSWLFEEVVSGGKMFASATSESGSGAKLRGITTSYQPVADGFVLNGRKSFVSLARVADYYVVAAVAQGSTEDDEVSHFVVSAEDAGVSFGGVWNGTALAGTETATMTMTDVLVPRERLFLGVEGVSLFKLVREPHWMVSGYMGAYLGIAAAILRFTTEFVRADAKRRDSAVLQAEVGRLASELAAARALVYEAARLVDEQKGTVATNSAVHAAKYYIGELAPRMALTAVRICGSAGLSRTQPLERLLRESAFCQVMPAKPDECLAYVGKAALGFNMFHTQTLDW